MGPTGRARVAVGLEGSRRRWRWGSWRCRMALSGGLFLEEGTQELRVRHLGGAATRAEVRPRLAEERLRLLPGRGLFGVFGRCRPDPDGRGAWIEPDGACRLAWERPAGGLQALEIWWRTEGGPWSLAPASRRFPTEAAGGGAALGGRHALGWIWHGGDRGGERRRRGAAGAGTAAVWRRLGARLRLGRRAGREGAGRALETSSGPVERQACGQDAPLRHGAAQRALAGDPQMEEVGDALVGGGGKDLRGRPHGTEVRGDQRAEIGLAGRSPDNVFDRSAILALLPGSPGQRSISGHGFLCLGDSPEGKRPATKRRSTKREYGRTTRSRVLWINSITPLETALPPESSPPGDRRRWAWGKAGVVGLAEIPSRPIFPRHGRRSLPPRDP